MNQERHLVILAFFSFLLIFQQFYFQFFFSLFYKVQSVRTLHISLYKKQLVYFSFNFTLSFYFCLRSASVDVKMTNK